MNKALYLPDPIEWIENEFYIPETNAPIVLEDYQRRVIREALSTDDNGLLRYSTILWSDLKKSAKSTLSGAIVLYLTWHNAYETARIVANDLKQADSRTFYYIERALKLNTRLGSQCEVQRYNIHLPNESHIQAVPIDPKGEAGGGDLITCFTELWAFKNTAPKQMWTETTLSPLKYGKSLRWCESYAGYVGESPILEQLYQQGIKEGERIDDDLELFRNGRLLALWNTKPRCYWQTPEYYAQEATQLHPSEYSRIHENRWSQSSQAFIPVEWWDACKGEYPAFSRGTPMVIGIDAAVSGDCFAMVGVSRVKGKVYPRYIRKWTAPANGKIDFNEPLQELERLAREYAVECATYDPYQLEFLAAQVTERGRIYMRLFNQGGERLEADKALYDAIRERTIVHDGNPDLREHILNSNAEIGKEDRKLRIVKRADNMKIDLTIALSMAHYTLIELEL